MEWHRIILSAEDRVKGVGQNLKIEFEIAFIAAGVPEAAALFVEPLDRGESYYFSPEASRIFSTQLDLIQADRCPAPQREHVRLAAGHGQAAELLVRTNLASGA